jgi:hypothetical protein
MKYILSNTGDLAKAIRKAIGASDGDVIEVVTPQFTRPVDWPQPSEAPTGMAEFVKLFSMTVKQLKELGCGNWDGRLMLFPKEWYSMIPHGFPIEDIMGNVESFVPGGTDDDIRYGFLSYGVAAINGIAQEDS